MPCQVLRRSNFVGQRKRFVQKCGQQIQQLLKLTIKLKFNALLLVGLEVTFKSNNRLGVVSSLFICNDDYLRKTFDFNRNFNELLLSFLQLSIRGFNHKQPVLLKKIFDRMTNFQVDPKRFPLIKERVREFGLMSFY